MGVSNIWNLDHRYWGTKTQLPKKVDGTQKVDRQNTYTNKGDR
jgi:hypothetical protein